MVPATHSYGLPFATLTFTKFSYGFVYVYVLQACLAVLVLSELALPFCRKNEYVTSKMVKTSILYCLSSQCLPTLKLRTIQTIPQIFTSLSFRFSKLLSYQLRVPGIFRQGTTPCCLEHPVKLQAWQKLCCVLPLAQTLCCHLKCLTTNKS